MFNLMENEEWLHVFNVGNDIIHFKDWVRNLVQSRDAEADLVVLIALLK